MNALSPILVTPLGMVIEVKLGQYPNAYLPILVTPLGMVIEVRLEHPQNLYMVVYQIDASIKVEK